MDILIFLIVWGFLAAAIICVVAMLAVVTTRKRRAGRQRSELLLDVPGLGARRVSAEVLIGRIVSAGLCLAKDAGVSVRHARIWRGVGGVFYIEDLGSTNGTLVNGQQITGPTLLAWGDSIRVGQTIIGVRQAPGPVAILSQPQPRQVAVPSRPTVDTHGHARGTSPKVQIKLNQDST